MTWQVTNLEVEVEVVYVGDPLVDDSPRDGVPISRRVRRVRRPEPCMVTLTADDDRESRLVWRIRGDPLEG